MRLAAVTRYRPTKVSDGEGGFTGTLGSGTAVYASLRVHRDRVTLISRSKEDIQPEDILLVNGAYYRILRLIGPVEGPMSEAEIERTERPIAP